MNSSISLNNSVCRCSNKRMRYFFVEKYYLILCILYAIFVFVPQMRIGIIITFLSAFAFLSVKKCNTRSNIPFFVFILWCLLSLLISIINSVSFTVAFSKFFNMVFPMFFFFLGKSRKTDLRKEFYKYFLIGAVFCFLIGLYWYILEPDYYMAFLERTIAGFHPSTYHLDRRFCSFFGSIGIGVISVCAMALFLDLFLKKRSKVYLLGYLSMAVMCGLCMQRSAYILAVVVTILILFFGKSSLREKRRLGFILLFSIVAALVALIFISNGALFDTLINRIKEISIDQLIGSRSYQWIRPIQVLGEQIIIGGGIGSFTYGSEVTVNDGLYFNLMGEIGIVGLILFIILVSSSFVSYFKQAKSKRIIVALVIVVVFLLNGVGSNGLLYMEIAPLFWFSLGAMNLTNKELSQGA